MQSMVITNGWCNLARCVVSPHKNARPEHEVSLLIIHNISLPAGHFGGDYIDQLFLGCLDLDADKSFSCLQGLTVSSHFLIRRDGELVQYVSCDDRAWHAGVSSFLGRENCNDFAIGIELEGTDDLPFTEQQYKQLVKLTQVLMRHYPLITKDRIVGHSDVAPERKTDPGQCFEWSKYKQQL